MSRPGSRGRRSCCRAAFDAIAARKDLGREQDRSRGARAARQSRARWSAAAPAGRRRRRYAHDAHPWRFPPRPGAGRQRRRLHHRLRGRAGTAAGRTPRARPARCATSPACCAPSTMRRRRRSTPRTSIASRVSPGRRERLITRLREGAEKAFLARLSRSRGQARPATATGGGLLDFFLIEKAAYEVTYEAANRPTWLAIPVAAWRARQPDLLAAASSAAS